MRTDIWMPIYIGDYLADTSRLTTEQHGAYLLLLMDYWRSGRLPDDDNILAQVCKLPLDKWIIHRGVLQGFFDISNGEWIHSRVEKELGNSKDKKMEQLKKSILGNFKKYGSIDERVHQDPVLAEWWENLSHRESHKDSPKDPSSPSPSPSPLELKSLTPIYEETKFPPCPYENLISLWGKHLPHLSQPRSWEGSRKTNMKQRWIQASKKSQYSPDGYSTLSDGIDWWDSFFEYIANDTKLSHGFESAGRTWKPDLEWVMNATNFQKIIDGKYNK